MSGNDKYNLWQVILHMKDFMDFKVLESKIILFNELVQQGHASYMVMESLKTGKINISADFVENDIGKKMLLKDVSVLSTKRKYAGYILNDIDVSDVLIDNVSIFSATSNTGN